MELTQSLAILKNEQIEYAFYRRSRNQPPVFQSNQKRFRSASLIKIPILLAWIELEKQGSVNRMALCNLDGEPPVGGAGFADRFSTRSIAFADVLLMMIADSDNLCTNLVLKEIGLERLQRVMVDALGLRKTKCERKLMDYAARDRGFDNWIDADECITLYRLINCLPQPEQKWVRSMLVVNTDSALLMRSIPRDTVEFFHKTGSMTGVLHDWGFTDDCELFLLTQNVTNEPVVFEVFGALGSQCLITTGI
jgi:beta-lactamase class A